MRDTVTWLIILVACAVVGILGYRYYKATQELALLTEKATRLTAEVEGVTEVSKLTEAKQVKEARKAAETIAGLTQSRDKLTGEVQGLQKELAKTRQEREALKTQVGALQTESKKLEGNLRALQGEKEKLDRRIEAVERTVKEREVKLQELEKARKADQEALRTWQGTGQRLLEEQKKLQAELRVSEEELKRASVLQAERAAEVHELTVVLKQREERIAALQKRIQELGGRMPPSGSPAVR